MNGHRLGAKERGLVLIVTIMAVTLVTLLALLAFALIKQESTASEAFEDFVTGGIAARSGFLVALELLSGPNPSYDSLNAQWASETEGKILDNSAQHEEETHYRLMITDVGSRINVNVANERILAALPGMEPDTLDAFLDWRDQDNMRRPNGVEREYYERLSEPYEPANGMLLAPGELRLVRGWVQLSGLSKLVTVYGLFNVNTADTEGLLNLLVQHGVPLAEAQSVIEGSSGRGEGRAASEGADSVREWRELHPQLSDKAWKALRPHLAVDGTINVNTVPVEALRVLIRGLGLPAEVADSLLEARLIEPFTDLAQLASFSGDESYRVLRDYLTVRSRFFQVDVLGYRAGSELGIHLQAVIERFLEGQDSGSSSRISSQTELKSKNARFSVLFWQEWRDSPSVSLLADH